MQKKIRALLKQIIALIAIMSLVSVCVSEEIDMLQGWDTPQGEDAIWQEPIIENINTQADIRIGYVASYASEINPFSCTERDLVSLNMLSFESVIEFDENMKPTPLLADSWTSEDKTWTFKLRDNIVFHNGAALTAYEVVASYERFLLAGENNPYYSRLRMIESMAAEDNLTLVVNSKYSGYITLYAMTFPVVQMSTLDDRIARGTGPYWITEYVQGMGVRFEANPLWWKNDAILHSVAAVRYNTSSEALQSLMLGNINMLSTQSGHAAISRRIADLTSMDFSTPIFECMVANLNENSIMGDLRMRKAIMYAIDRAAIAENAYAGMGVQCEVPINPSSWLYESQSAIYYYSPERALQLVLECGWEDMTGDGIFNKIDGVMLTDLTVRLITYNESASSTRENAANMIASYLKQVGIKTEITVYSRSRCLQKVKDKDYDLALVGMNMSDVPNLSVILGYGGALNLNNFKNEEMEGLLSRVSSAQDEVELKDLYSQMQKLVVARLPVLGLLFRTGTVLSRRSLAGLSGIYAGNTLNGIEFMQYE